MGVLLAFEVGFGLINTLKHQDWDFTHCVQGLRLNTVVIDITQRMRLGTGTITMRMQPTNGSWDKYSGNEIGTGT